ncbi:hypothetical protein AGMMS49938_16380 [Fibrobacterales bacterium]|nr:hypothetical protein AGMMS49938_16380 [Fibrobacterales bacterium]
MVGANNSLNAVQGAKSAGLGSAALPVQNDLPSLVQNSLQLADFEKLAIAFSHNSYFEGSAYNGVTMALPLGGRCPPSELSGGEAEGGGKIGGSFDYAVNVSSKKEGYCSAGTLAFAMSRFGASDIPYIKEGDPLPEGDNYNTLNIADYLFTSAWGRSFGQWNFAFALHLLHRSIDQSGWGFRSDVAGGYEFSPRFAVSAVVKGFTASAVKWESGYFEYSSPETQIAFKFSEPFPYFYGKLNAYFQSTGLLHSESEHETRIWKNAGNWFLSSGAGLEFETNFHFSLRAGLVSFRETESLTLGAGITPTSWLQADYAYQKHPELAAVHRISISCFVK